MLIHLVTALAVSHQRLSVGPVYRPRGSYWYEGASLADLTEAMEISKPTLYAAFGDKQGLLREVLPLYLGLHAKDYAAALNRPTVREVAEAWLRLTGGVREEAGVPSVCFLVGEPWLAVRQATWSRTNSLPSEMKEPGSWNNGLNERSGKETFQAHGIRVHWHNIFPR